MPFVISKKRCIASKINTVLGRTHSCSHGYTIFFFLMQLILNQVSRNQLQDIGANGVHTYHLRCRVYAAWQTQENPFQPQKKGRF